MKKLAVLAILAMFVLGACYTQTHTVGAGPQTGETTEVRQWFVLYGLIPLTEADSQEMAAGATDYEIVTEMNLIDVVIGMFTQVVTVAPRTVTVTR
ncbi:MAG: Bor/Iss family lipoprotein [Spirochaetia bacterium]